MKFENTSRGDPIQFEQFPLDLLFEGKCLAVEDTNHATIVFLSIFNGGLWISSNSDKGFEEPVEIETDIKTRLQNILTRKGLDLTGDIFITNLG